MAVARPSQDDQRRSAIQITTLFLDIGGVLLTNGWDHHARKRAATEFGLDWAEMEDRHHLTSDTYEEGKLALKEYLGRVVFHRNRPFTQGQFRRFMFAQSDPFTQGLDRAEGRRWSASRGHVPRTPGDAPGGFRASRSSPAAGELDEELQGRRAVW
jgi:hypothetical protein